MERRPFFLPPPENSVRAEPDTAVAPTVKLVLDTRIFLGSTFIPMNSRNSISSSRTVSAMTAMRTHCGYLASSSFCSAVI